jgi:hypothetical protein
VKPQGNPFSQLLTFAFIGFMIKLLLEYFNLLILFDIPKEIVRKADQRVSPDNLIVEVRQSLNGAVILLINNKL